MRSVRCSMKRFPRYSPHSRAALDWTRSQGHHLVRAGSSREGGLIRWTAVLSVTATVLLVTPAWAYVDPNAGGIIFQIAMPILSIGAAAIALFRKRISGFVKRLRPGAAPGKGGSRA